MKRVCALFVLAYCLLMALACNQYRKNAAHENVPDESIAAGKKLAATYCASCHQLPDPSLLDAKSWEKGVLPQMGPRLGIFAYGYDPYPSFRNDLNVGKNFYPSQPVMPLEDWQHIIDYYTALAPDSIQPAKKPVAITMTDSLFTPLAPAGNFNRPAVSFIAFEPHKAIVYCDVIKQKMFFFDSSLQPYDSVNTRTPVTDILETENNYITCNTGLLNPNNGRYGSVQTIAKKQRVIDTLFKGLMRPVEIAGADINKDGKQDYIVCEFGNLKGALSWYEQTDSGYTRHVLRNVPGAIKAYVSDYNGDGLPDIWALFAQGNEGVFLFTNKGNGNFETKQVLSFPPSYGSSSFELDDFNKDGFPDVVYTCGDNADYSIILKPYHGVYIFLNDGKNNFTQHYFYPINGCYKAIAKDFDGDGDLDIATIAFFADYAREPEEGFVYLKNAGNGKFMPYSLKAAENGRWLTMNAGDYDGDGKPDLILGNFTYAGSKIRSGVDWSKQPPFLILKNIQ